MKGWLKRFTLSLFSDEQAKESVKFGFGNILLTSVLAVMFLFLGIFAGGTAPFASYYDGAEDFRDFLYTALDGVSVTTGDGSAVIASGGNAVDINTFSNAEDGDRYALNGYHLFVNSVSVASEYDDFYAYCVKTDGGEVDYETYRSLPESVRKNYRFAVRYTGKIKNVYENTGSYEAFLKGLNDEEVNSQLQSFAGNRNEYQKFVYTLYVKNFYPDMTAATGEVVPTLRTYYYRQTLETDGKYLCLFGDIMVASFKTYNGNEVSFGGTYKAGNNLADGGSSKAVGVFIKNCFYDGASMMFLVELMGSISVIAVGELLAVAVMLLGFAVCKARKSGACLKFADSARIVGSYVHVAALISAVATLCLSFAFGGIAVSVIAYVSFALILIVRTAVLLLREKKSPEEASVNEE